MKFNLEKTKNIHLKLIQNKDIEILNKILDELLKTRDNISILNIGGGFSKPNEKFLRDHKNTSYFTLDIQNNENQKNIFLGDITDTNLELGKTFDFIYTADTFEHILNPWDATKNIKKLLNNGGFLFCKAPFSWRYHACPFDTYRYSHTGMRYLFEYQSHIKPILSAYKKCKKNKGWYADKTDLTMDGNEFKECIETYYIGKKDENYKFSLSNFDKGWKRN